MFWKYPTCKSGKIEGIEPTSGPLGAMKAASSSGSKSPEAIFGLKITSSGTWSGNAGAIEDRSVSGGIPTINGRGSSKK